MRGRVIEPITKHVSLTKMWNIRMLQKAMSYSCTYIPNAVMSIYVRSAGECFTPSMDWVGVGVQKYILSHVQMASAFVVIVVSCSQKDVAFHIAGHWPDM